MNSKIISALLLLTFLTDCLYADSLSDAEAALKKNQFDTAIRIYRQHLGAEPSSYEARFGLAHALAYSGKRQEAIEILNQLLKENPDDPDVRLSRGRVYAWEKKYKEAEDDLLSVTQKFPKYADGWSALGDLHLWTNRARDSISSYDRIIEQQEKSPEGFIARAKAYRALRNFPKSREDLHKALALGGNKAEIDELLRDLDRIPSAKTWESSFSLDYQYFSSDRDEWGQYNSYLKRELSFGSVILEIIQADRFSKHDTAIAWENYVNLWKRAYLNGRYQTAFNTDFLPHTDIFFELFQSFGKGWELSGSYRYSHFSSDKVDQYGIAVSRYYKNWFAREKTVLIPGAAGLSYAQSVSLRRYFSTVDDFLEAGGGFGKEVLLLGVDARVEDRKNSFYTFRIQKFVRSWLGVSLSVNYNDDEKVPQRRGLTVQILSRW